MNLSSLKFFFPFSLDDDDDEKLIQTELFDANAHTEMYTMESTQREKEEEEERKYRCAIAH